MKTRTVTSLAVLIVVCGALPAMAQTTGSQTHTAPKATSAEPASSPPQSSGSNTKRDNGPSLEETLQWIKNALSSEGSTTWVARYTNGNYVVNDRIELSRESGCDVAFVDYETTTSTPADVPLPKKGKRSTHATNLRNLDPSSVKVNKFPSEDCCKMPDFFVNADTTGFAKVISSTTEMNGVNKASQDSSLRFYISSEEFGQRLAKALSHAITLCGGKSSAF